MVGVKKCRMWGKCSMDGVVQLLIESLHQFIELKDYNDLRKVMSLVMDEFFTSF